MRPQGGCQPDKSGPHGGEGSHPEKRPCEDGVRGLRRNQPCPRLGLDFRPEDRGPFLLSEPGLWHLFRRLTHELTASPMPALVPGFPWKPPRLP